uniref:peptidylprolyl isomerase n=1 Tax=Hypseocharis bilobata TaxID=253189 RepID=A0A0F7H0X6_9ROSI
MAVSTVSLSVTVPKPQSLQSSIIPKQQHSITLKPTLSPSFSSSSCFSHFMNKAKLSLSLNLNLNSISHLKKCISNVGIGLLAASVFVLTPLEANATRIEYYATVGEPSCELNYVRSGLGYCDVLVGSGEPAPRGELINVHYTARFGDETVFDSSYKRGRPLTMRIGVGKVIKGLDQGILGGEGVPPMQIGGKRKLKIPPQLAYGPEPAGCFSGDCNIPANATLLYDINFVGVYSGNRK